MPRFSQMMEKIIGLNGWVDFTNEWNGHHPNQADEEDLTDIPIRDEDEPNLIE